MDKINKKIFQANIDLVDKNRVLEQDKKILTKRIKNTVEIIKIIDENNNERLLHKYLDIIKRLLRGEMLDEQRTLLIQSISNKEEE